MINNDSILNQLNNYKKLNNAGVGITMRNYPTYVERYYPITTDIDTYNLIDVQIKKSSEDEGNWISIGKKTLTYQQVADDSENGYTGNWGDATYKAKDIIVNELKDIYFYEYSTSIDSQEWIRINKYYKKTVDIVEKLLLPYTNNRSADFASANNVGSTNPPASLDMKIIYTKNNVTQEPIIFSNGIVIPFILSLYGWQSYDYTFVHHVTDIEININGYPEVPIDDITYYHGETDITNSIVPASLTETYRYGFMPTWYQIIAQNLLLSYTNFKIFDNDKELFSFKFAISFIASQSPYS